MADYQDIRGLRVKYLSADPSVTVGGEVWYTSTTATLRSHLISEAWASAAPLAQERGQISMFGVQTSSVAAGGSGPGATMYNDTEEYNGSGWSAGGDLNTTREGSHAAGVLTAGVIVGGFIEPSTYSNAVEEYDGSTWTSVTSTPYAVNNVGAFGTQAASMFAGGDPGSKTTTLEYASPGSWTAGGALTTGRAQAGGACLAPLSAGLIWGGTPLSTAVEEYNGTAWSDGTVLPAGVQFGGGAGTQTAALSFANFSGPTTITTATTKYDGTSWTAAPALGISQARSQGSGSQTAALLAGGDYPHTTPVATTQEFNRSMTVITPASWSAGGSLSLGVFGRNFTNQGTQNAGNVNGGYAPYKVETEEYNGTSWTGGGNSANARYFGTGGGTQTAGIVMGGGLPPAAPVAGATNLTEEYNGASWTAGGNMPAPAANMVGGGTQTAAIAAGGTGPIVTTNFYNGASWSTQPNNMNDATRERTGCGTQSSFVAFGGANPTETAMQADTEEWDGTSWSQMGNLVVAVKAMSCMGHTATGAVANGGMQQSPLGSISTTQIFNGTSIETGIPNSHAANNNSGNQGCGTAALGFTAAKYLPAQGTEEYVGETTAINYRTITTR